MVMHARRTAALALAALSTACGGARPRTAAGPPPASSEVRLEVAGQGALVLRLPAGWTASPAEAAPGAPATTRVDPGDRSFVVLLTPMWREDRTEGPADPEEAQRLAELARREMGRTAAETEIALHELVGPSAHGYWFSATDRDLVGKEVPAGEWRCVTQGAVAVGRVLLAFTLLDDGPGPQRSALVEGLRGISQEQGGAGERGGVLEGEPLAVSLPGRSWAVLIDLAGFATQPPRLLEGGRGVVALAADTRSNAVASIVLRPADGAADARACRDRDLARIRGVVPGVRDVRVREAGPSARGRYVVPEIDGRPVAQLNVHAWRFRDGTCVNVHLSTMEPEPEDEAALERILDTVRISESM
jgi:hypothetical protein